MAYRLKYTSFKQYPNGDRIDLKIYQKDWLGTNYGIGALTGFALQLQGDQSSLTSPIVKTSVEITLKDVFDRGTIQTDGTTCVEVVGEVKQKWGQWEEFWTNDPTKYRVDVEYTGGLTRNSKIWSGYVTPDSWGEEMSYRGDIKLVARDMLGYLEEHEFDMTGVVTIQSLISGAITKSLSPMGVTFHTTECLYNANGSSILAATIGAAAYAGNTWYQALEKCLESLGLVLRYDGNGGFFVTSVRYLADHAVETHVPQFINGSGYRTLEPALKQIIETFNPKWESYDCPDAEASHVSQASGTWTCRYYHVTWHEETIQKYQITGDENWSGYAASLPGKTAARAAWQRNIYLPVNSTTDIGLIFSKAGLVAPCKAVFNFSTPQHVVGNYIYPTLINNCEVRDINIVVSMQIGGTTMYLGEDGVWSATSTTLTVTNGQELEIPYRGDQAASDLRITINRCNEDDNVDNSIPHYAAFDLSLEALDDSTGIAGEYKTTTIYNQTNRLEINRTPSIASVNGSTSLPFLVNVLGYAGEVAQDSWKFSGDTTGYPLSVMIHAQLLVYHVSTNGNSVFTGSFVDATRPTSIPGTKYTYYQRSCVLLSGAFDFLTGYVNSATLREVMAWGSVWDPFAPDYTVKTSASEGGTAASGKGSSSGGGGGSTGGSVTSVDMSVPTGMTIGGNPITTRGTLALGLAEGYNFLTDSYKATLDGHLADRSSNPHNTTWSKVASKSSQLATPEYIQTAYIGDGQVTLAKLAQGIRDILDLFEKDTTSVQGQTLIHAKYALYSHEEITAGGIGSGGGGGGAAIWGAITGTLSNQTDLMNALNGKASASHTHTIGNITGLQDALDGKQALITSSNKLAYSLISGTPDLSVYATTSALAAHTGNTTIHITASERSTWNNKQDAATAITTSNIGSQSVAYATSAGNADTLDSLHATSFAQYTEYSSPDNAYDFGFGRFARGSGSPTGTHYGQFLTLPYRRATGNSKPDFSWQILGPNGDDPSYPDDIFVRTSLADSWRSWHKLYHSGNCNNTSTPWTASSLTLNGKISGATTGEFSTYLLAGSIKLQYTDEINRYGGTLYLQYRGHESNPTGSIAMCVNGGNVGIGTASPSEKLYVSGNILATGEVTAGSDLRWKENIASLTDYKSILNALSPVEWDWKEGHGNGHSCGFIAQQIADIMPYAVKGNEKDGYTLNYNTFHAIWATALQSHESRIEALERENAELKNTIARLTMNS